MTKFSVFAETADGRAFVRQDAIMSFLVASIDGLTLHFMGKNGGGPAYLDLGTAIAWVEKELEREGVGKKRFSLLSETLDTLRAAAAAHAAAKPANRQVPA